jgi:hypothetical protein
MNGADALSHDLAGVLGGKPAHFADVDARHIHVEVDAIE